MCTTKVSPEKLKSKLDQPRHFSMKNPRKLANNLRYALGLTHYIRIPFLNQSSSSQIQETLWQVANDPISAEIPHLAYQPLQRLSLSIAALSLPTDETKRQAIELLQDLGKQDWRKLFCDAQAARINAQTSLTLNPGSLEDGSVDHYQPRPLVVSLSLK